MLTNITKVRVRYADTDQMQFVYNAKYFEYFEVGRTEMLRENGLPYSLIEKNELMLPVLETFVKYHSPAYYDDVLDIESLVKELPAFKIHIDYVVKKENSDILLAEGYTEHVFIKRDTKKPVRIPDFFTEKMKQFFD
jgi:acyl-CoA thioester hydrolase